MNCEFLIYPIINHDDILNHNWYCHIQFLLALSDVSEDFVLGSIINFFDFDQRHGWLTVPEKNFLVKKSSSMTALDLLTRVWSSVKDTNVYQLVTKNNWTKSVTAMGALYLFREVWWMLWRKYKKIPPGPTGWYI